jgi:pimeloyl-ACP methyl ester carboxylesterase
VLGLLVVAAIVGVMARTTWEGWRLVRFERELVFRARPLDPSDTPERAGLAGAVDVEYGRSDGAPLRAWYAAPRNGSAILFVPGAGSNRLALVREAALLRGAGYGVLLLDLPGTGASGGRITGGRSEEAAIAAAVDFLQRQGAARIGALGFSLGSIFLAHAAAADPRLHAVVLEAPSTSVIDRMRATHGSRAWLATLAWFREGTNPWHDQSREDVRAIAPRPVLLVTGARDAWASPRMGQELAASGGPSARLELFDAGHGGYWEAEPARYTALLLSFFASGLHA